MWRSLVLLLLGLVPAATQGQDVRAAILGPRADDGDAVAAWIGERMTAARDGQRDSVRLPLVFKADGWGCVCPPHFVGISPHQHHGGETWLRVVNDSGEAFPPVPIRRIAGGVDGSFEASAGQVVRVDGYFTGEVEHVDLEGDGDWVYDLRVFHVTRIHGRMRDAEDARVALLGSTS